MKIELKNMNPNGGSCFFEIEVVDRKLLVTLNVNHGKGEGQVIRMWGARSDLLSIVRACNDALMRITKKPEGGV